MDPWPGAAEVSLDLNGHAADLDDDAAFELATSAAEGRLDVEQIAERRAIRPS